MSFRKPCHMLFRNLIPSFNLTAKINNDFCGQTTTPKPRKSALGTRLVRQTLRAKVFPELTLNPGFGTGKTVHFPLNRGVSSTEVTNTRSYKGYVSVFLRPNSWFAFALGALNIWKMTEEDDRAVDVFYNLRELIRHELSVICKQYGTYKIILST